MDRSAEGDAQRQPAQYAHRKCHVVELLAVHKDAHSQRHCQIDQDARSGTEGSSNDHGFSFNRELNARSALPIAGGSAMSSGLITWNFGREGEFNNLRQANGRRY